ncbi:testis-expressed protein 264 homolog [Oncorhynchus nerka]|uniref:testis-expressed protein 264 homolog n=1 Tax=Oncorhynchus nerka TaxID=8023 RepID=UPI0031B89B42
MRAPAVSDGCVITLSVADVSKPVVRKGPCTIESILSGCITAWYGNCTVHNHKALQRVVWSVQCITGGKLPTLLDTCSTQCHRMAKKIIKDIYHPSHCLFTPLSCRRRGDRRKCRCAVGSVLSEGDTRPSEELQQLYEKFGFRVFSFPEVTHVVSASFPHRTPLSIFFGVQRVYPQLESYIKERKLCAHPCLEIYRDDLIHYMSPLARQGDFYVPEVRQDPDRRLLGDNDSEEDRGTDITGADSNSECSSGSGVFLSDSRETSLAPSSVPSLIRHYRGGTGGGGGEDRSDRSSSSSSFEELDMELPDGQEEAGTEQASDAPGNKHLETTTEERGVVAGGEE